MSDFVKKWLIKLAIFLIEKLADNYLSSSSTLSGKQVLFLKNAAKLITYTSTLQGYEVTAGELWRTNEQQAIYLAKGLSKTKHSKHQDRLAIDLNVFVDGVYRTDKSAFKPLADYWASLDKDNVSGYNWGWDYNHFEMK